MKKIWIILVIIPIVLVAVYLLNNIKGFSESKAEDSKLQENLPGEKDFAGQTNDLGEVNISVKPITLETGKEAVFEVVLDTHSVPLDFDLVKISKLADGEGNVYQPVSWTGGTGGHHLSGNLSFPPIPKTKFIELSIFGINNIDRNFKWEL